MPDNRKQKDLTPADRRRSVAPRSTLARRGLELALNVRQQKEREAVSQAMHSEGDAYDDFTRLALQDAEQGNTTMQWIVGYMYDEGDGLPQDDAAAVRWYRRAAEQGHEAAQFNLGCMYAEGQGVPQDDVEAAYWYRQAAEQGDAEAQYKLGDLYDDGRGVPQDYIQAHKWFNLAASRGSSSVRDVAVQSREEVGSKMTPAQIAEAQRLAREWEPGK